jgi:hypothetical protein
VSQDANPFQGVKFEGAKGHAHRQKCFGCGAYEGEVHNVGCILRKTESEVYKGDQNVNPPEPALREQPMDIERLLYETNAPKGIVADPYTGASDSRVIHNTPLIFVPAPKTVEDSTHTPELGKGNKPEDLAKGGVKYDDGKVGLHLLPVRGLVMIAMVLDFGASKYLPHNWTKGIAYSRIYRACLGHLWDWWTGEECDPESGLPHLAHLGCNVLFLLDFLDRQDSSLDDRPLGKIATARVAETNLKKREGK